MLAGIQRAFAFVIIGKIRLFWPYTLINTPLRYHFGCTKGKSATIALNHNAHTNGIARWEAYAITEKGGNMGGMRMKKTGEPAEWSVK